eukprot:CAMPEP_0194398296 /NCGR_PEP_ID=MMETSP0174-20130528/126024_1 /TAXON_ID=216777 /ORGANISM="Proboscia alata, Strain PI-D3" /LENGTH=681 /DNA_ID=CAMNT_0039194575 /DNA_START=76 /DNA_END=2119 /DNA_ORIENTATION=+
MNSVYTDRPVNTNTNTNTSANNNNPPQFNDIDIQKSLDMLENELKNTPTHWVDFGNSSFGNSFDEADGRKSPSKYAPTKSPNKGHRRTHSDYSVDSDILHEEAVLQDRMSDEMAMGQSTQEYYDQPPQVEEQNDPRMAALRALSRSASTDQERADVNELNQLMSTTSRSVSPRRSPRSSTHNSRTCADANELNQLMSTNRSVSPVRRSSIHSRTSSRTSSPVKAQLPPRSSTPETQEELEEVKLHHHIENDDSSTYFIDDNMESERAISPAFGLWSTIKGVICHDEASAQLCHFCMGLLTVAAFVSGVLLFFDLDGDVNLAAGCRNNCTAEELSYITMKVHTMSDAAYDVRSNQIYQTLVSSKISTASNMQEKGTPQQRALRYVTYLTQDVDLWDIAEERHLLQLYGLACLYYGTGGSTMWELPGVHPVLAPVRRSSIHSRTTSPVKVPQPRSSTPETQMEEMEEVKLHHHIENDDSSTYFIDDVESERAISTTAGLWATIKGVICHDEASAQLCHFCMGLLTVAAFVSGVLLFFDLDGDVNLAAGCRNNCTAEELSYITMKVHTMSDAAYDVRSNQIYQTLVSSKISTASNMQEKGTPQQRALRYVTYLTQDVDLWDIAEERHLLQLYGLACLYYGTGGSTMWELPGVHPVLGRHPWMGEKGWLVMGEEGYCGWGGVVCS